MNDLTISLVVKLFGNRHKKSRSVTRPFLPGGTCGLGIRQVYHIPIALLKEASHLLIADA